MEECGKVPPILCDYAFSSLKNLIELKTQAAWRIKDLAPDWLPDPLSALQSCLLLVVLQKPKHANRHARSQRTWRHAEM